MADYQSHLNNNDPHFHDQHEVLGEGEFVSNNVKSFAFNRVYEMFGIALFLAVAYAIFAMLSWTPTDPSYNNATTKQVENSLGMTGAQISDFLIQNFGIAVIFLIIPVVSVGWGLLRHHVFQRPILRLLAWIMGGLFLAGAIGALPIWGGWPLDQGLGGLSGKVTISIVSDLLGSSSSVTVKTISAVILAIIGASLALYACGMKYREMISAVTFSDIAHQDEQLTFWQKLKRVGQKISHAFSNIGLFFSKIRHRKTKAVLDEKKPWKHASNETPLIYEDLTQKQTDQNLNNTDNIATDLNEQSMKNLPNFLSKKSNHEVNPSDGMTKGKPSFINKLVSGFVGQADERQAHIEPEFNPYAFEPIQKPKPRQAPEHIPALNEEVKQYYQNLDQQAYEPEQVLYQAEHVRDQVPHFETQPAEQYAAPTNHHVEVIGSAEMGDFYDGPNSYDDYWSDATVVHDEYRAPVQPPMQATAVQEAHPFAPEYAEQNFAQQAQVQPMQQAPVHAPVNSHDAFDEAAFYGFDQQDHYAQPVAPQPVTPAPQYAEPHYAELQYHAPEPQAFAPEPQHFEPQPQMSSPVQQQPEMHNAYMPQPTAPTPVAAAPEPAMSQQTQVAHPAFAANHQPVQATSYLPEQVQEQVDAALAPVAKVEEVASPAMSLPKAANGNGQAQQDAPFDLSVPQVDVRKGKSFADVPMEGEGFILPPLDLLAEPQMEGGKSNVPEKILAANARILENVLAEFRISGEIMNVRPGPVVTLYELEPAPGVKSARVIGLADDIARSMSAISARIAVIPGRNVIGIELPNERRDTVYLNEIIRSDEFKNDKLKLPIALGKSIDGSPIVADLARMPHVLIAGTTGSGKSVGINSMILSILYKYSPEDCKLVMVDPKMLELSIYDGIPHLLTPVVTDSKKAVVALKWSVREMENRYKKMSKMGVRNIEGYNQRVKQAEERGEPITRTVQTGFDHETGKPVYETEELDYKKMPFIVIVIDEMADLMMVAGKEIEGAIQRLAQMARAAGIHIITATQRPSVDVITGSIKANFPTRISFQVTSKIDSRTILNEMGAEQLLGQGDMLHMAGGGRISRVHGAFVSDEEVESIVNHLKRQGVPEYIDDVTTDVEEGEVAAADGGPAPTHGENGEALELYDQAVAIVARDKKASTSYIQRKLSIGYNRAATIIERMEEEGVVGPANHAGKREILISEAPTLE